MTIAERSRRRVEAARSRLRARHGTFDVVEDGWELDAVEYERLRERFEAGTVGGAGAWVANDEGEVLLVRERGERAWSEPSGKHEPGETLAETARREVAEETNVECELTGVAMAQAVEMVHPERPPLHRLIVVFEADYVRGEPAPADGEIDEVRWWDEHPPNLRYDALERLEIPAEAARR